MIGNGRKRSMPSGASRATPGAGRRGGAMDPAAPAPGKRQHVVGTGQAAPPPLRGATASRTQVLATFHAACSLAEGGAAAAARTAGQQQAGAQQGGPELSPQGQHMDAPHGAPATAACAPTAAETVAVHGPMPVPHAELRLAEPGHTAGAPSGAPPTAGHRPVLPAATPAPTVPAMRQLIGELRRCRERITQRKGAYLYTCHEDLAAAQQALAAVVTALLPPGTATAAAGDPAHTTLLRDACMSCMDVCCSVLRNHTNEPSAADEARPFYDGARRIWAAAMEPSADVDGGLEPEVLLELLTSLAQMGKAWLAASRVGEAGWPYQALRERLGALESLGRDACQSDGVRRTAQALQFCTLQGSLVLAGFAGHQALWANLVARLQRLLDTCDLAPSQVALICQQLADTLADQANPPPAARAAGAAGAAGQPTAARSGAAPAQLLTCAEGLIAHALRLVSGMAADSGVVDGETEPADVEAWMQQLRHAWIEVRLRMSEALLAEGSPAAARDAAAEALEEIGSRGSGDAAADPGAAGGAAGGSGSDGPLAVRAAKLVVSSLLAAGRQDDAASELSAWIGSNGADARATSEVLGVFAAGCDLRRPGAPEQLSAIAIAAVRAHRGRHDPAMAVAERLLLSVAASGPSPADDVALRVLADNDAADAIKKVPDVRARCHTLLYSRGLKLYSQKCFPAARAALASALFYSPPGAAHARAARLLAASCGAVGDKGAALGYLDQAARHEPAGMPCPTGRLLELRVLLALLPRQGTQTAGEPQQQQQQQCGEEGVGGGSTELGGSPEEEEDEVSRRLGKAIAGLPAAQRTAAPGASDVMQLAYEEALAAGAPGAAWQVLATWRHALSAAAGGQAQQQQQHLAQQALGILGRITFIHKETSSEAATAVATSAGLRLPAAAGLLEEAAEAAGLCASAITPLLAGSASESGLSVSAGSTCNQAILQAASTAARITRQLGADAVAAAAWVPAAALLEATAHLLGAMGTHITSNSSKEDSVAKDHAAALEVRRRGALRAAAAALLRARDVAPSEAGPTHRAIALLRGLRQEVASAEAASAAAGGDQGTSGLLALKLELLAATQAGAAQRQRRLLTALSQHPAARPEDALAAAASALAPRPWRSEPAAMLALGFALRVAADRPCPGSAAAAVDAAQRLLRLPTSSTVRMRALSRVQDALGSVGGGGSSPVKQPANGGAAGVQYHQRLRWLLAQCWNYAVEAWRGGDEEEGEAYRAAWRRLACSMEGGAAGDSSDDASGEEGSQQGSEEQREEGVAREEAAVTAAAPLQEQQQCSSEHEVMAAMDGEEEEQQQGVEEEAVNAPAEAAKASSGAVVVNAASEGGATGATTAVAAGAGAAVGVGGGEDRNAVEGTDGDGTQPLGGSGGAGVVTAANGGGGCGSPWAAGSNASSLRLALSGCSPGSVDGPPCSGNPIAGCSSKAPTPTCDADDVSQRDQQQVLPINTVVTTQPSTQGILKAGVTAAPAPVHSSQAAAGPSQQQLTQPPSQQPGTPLLSPLSDGSPGSVVAASPSPDVRPAKRVRRIVSMSELHNSQAP